VLAIFSSALIWRTLMNWSVKNRPLRLMLSVSNMAPPRRVPLLWRLSPWNVTSFVMFYS